MRHSFLECGSPLPLWKCRAGWNPIAGPIAILLVLLTAPIASAQTDSLALLQTRLSNHIDAPRFAAAAWGIQIVSLDTGRTLFARDAQKLLKPASNAKLYTAALVLDRFGPDFRIQTSLRSRSRPDKSGTLRDDLVVYGRGDPSFAARFHDGAHTNLLAPLADALAAAGVKRIKGDLVGDESFFRGPPLGSQWAWEDLQYYYGAETSSLTIEDNTVDLLFSPGTKLDAPCRIVTLPVTSYLQFDNRTRTVAAGGRRQIQLYRPIGENIVHVTGQLPLGSTNFLDAAAVHQPASWFVSLLAEELDRRGIRVSGKLRIRNWLDHDAHPDRSSNLLEIASVPSPTLAGILPKMLKPSQNLYAQLLLLQAGAPHHHATNSSVNTEDLGLSDLLRFLTEAGIAPNTVLLEDGSGLSRGTLVTPAATVALLQFMHRHRYARVFRESLPVAGVDGTLRNRMRLTAAAENVRAKTGTLRYVNTLSGYVTTRAGEPLAFSLMLNNYDGLAARSDLDTIAVMLAEWNEHSPTP